MRMINELRSSSLEPAGGLNRKWLTTTMKLLQFFSAVQAAIDFGGPGYGEDPVLGFNTASQHVLVLLEDAVAAFERGSYGTSVFLAITALEETAKAELLGFRIQKPEVAQKKRSDPLHSHTKKHALEPD